MDFLEYPKWTFDDKKIVNSKEEETEYLKSIGVISNDKENCTGVSGEIGKGEESQQAESNKKTGGETPCPSGIFQEQTKENSPVGLLKRKAGRPRKL